MASVFLRRGYFYCRVIIPTSLRVILGARAQLWKSLRTHSKNTATLRAALWEGRVSRLFFRLAQSAHTMTPAQINKLVAEYVNADLEASEETSLTISRTDAQREGASLGLTSALEDIQHELIDNDFKRVVEAAEELLSKHSLSVERDSLDWKRLCRGLLVGFQTVVRAELRALEGDYSPQPPTNGETDTRGPVTVSRRFSEVSALYFTENKRAPRTDGQIKAEFMRFLAVIGGDKPLGHITKADCRLYKEARLKSIRAATVNKHLHSLAHLFTWASGQGFVQEDYNPIKGLLIHKRTARQEKQARKPFTDAQLALILGHPEFLKQRHGKHPERFWMVLCLLLSGARREEIAQLQVGDIGDDSGVAFFNITNEAEGQSLKNAGSKRRVPVHAELVRLGFLKYVHHMRKVGGSRLFPNLTRGKNGYGDAVGKWFSRLLRHHLKLTDPALVLHGFRHTVITRLTSTGVPQDIREVLVGHSSETVHGQTYVHRDAIPLSHLKSHLDKLNFRPLLKGLPRPKI